MDKTRKEGAKDGRADRLAQALRENLHRRKDQARQRKAAEPARPGKTPRKP